MVLTRSPHFALLRFGLRLVAAPLCPAWLPLFMRRGETNGQIPTLGGGAANGCLCAVRPAASERRNRDSGRPPLRAQSWHTRTGVEETYICHARLPAMPALSEPAIDQGRPSDHSEVSHETACPRAHRRHQKPSQSLPAALIAVRSCRPCMPSAPVRARSVARLRPR